MVKLVNRAKMTITAVASSGTGALTLGAASAGGFQTFADAGVSNGETVRYTIEGPNAGDFEIGTGIYTASGTTLSRTPTESSNSNYAITATTDSVVFVTAAAADLGARVHANVTSLLAQTGMVVGDTAFIESNKNLMMYTASGWFLIATLTNTAPSAISGAAASYKFATDGTATVVTLSATDPEGFTLTYSHAVTSGSLGSTATVTQSNNVFTITPSSNTSHAGAFQITFSTSDGNSASSTVSAFSLAFGFDISGATYDGDSAAFDHSATADRVDAAHFNPAGTKLFLLNYGNDTIYQYTLTTGYDLTTASYDNLSFYVGAKEDRPLGLLFNPSGTRMFVSGFGSDSVHQWNLTNGFSIASSNVTYSKVYSANLIAPSGLAFNSDGSKLFIVDQGNGADHIEVHSLPTNYDLGSASQDSTIFSTLGQDQTPEAIEFSSDGKKLVMLGSATDKVYLYTLTSAFDLSTISYSGTSFSVASQATSPAGLAFNSDGDKMFVTGPSSDKLYRYSC